MRGCNYSCTYCIVPYVRGREIYHPMEQILSEVRARVTEGAREIMLLGQTVNSYHREGSKGLDTDFSDLLKAVAAVDGVERVRFISPHPYYMTDRVIDAMAAIPEVCEWVHLPVQSGSDPILKKMLRTYTREHYLRLVEKMRKAMPGVTISTDLIVGFPGESAVDFGQTLSLIEEAQFDWGFIFKYSSREGTPAAAWESFPRDAHRGAAQGMSCSDRASRAWKETNVRGKPAGSSDRRRKYWTNANQLQGSSGRSGRARSNDNRAYRERTKTDVRGKG